MALLLAKIQSYFVRVVAAVVIGTCYLKHPPLPALKKEVRTTFKMNGAVWRRLL
jgi:hypothetical protein